MEPIPGRPTVLVVDGAIGPDGLAASLVAALQRRGIAVHAASPSRPGAGAALPQSGMSANCVLVLDTDVNLEAVVSLPNVAASSLLILAGEATGAAKPSSSPFAATVRVLT